MGGEGGRKEKEIISGGIPELLWGGEGGGERKWKWGEEVAVTGYERLFLRRGRLLRNTCGVESVEAGLAAGGTDGCARDPRVFGVGKALPSD